MKTNRSLAASAVFKKMGVLAAIVSLCALSSSAFGQTLLSLYSFNNTANNTISGAPNGTPLNSPTYITGQIGNAIQLNGTTQRVDTGAGSFPRGAGLKEATYSFWFQTVSTATGGYIFNGTSGPGTTTVQLRFNLSTVGAGTHQDGNFWLLVRDNLNQQVYWSMDNSGNYTSNQNGQWNHLSVAWATPEITGGSSQVNFYLNGAAVGSSLGGDALTASSVFSNWTATSIGASTSNTQFFLGGLDDQAAWGGRLSSTQATALYNLGVNSLNYGAFDASGLFSLYNAGTGNYTAATDGKVWQYVGAGSLTGTPGTIVNNGGFDALILNADGSGVSVIPEPTTAAFLLLGAGLVAFRRMRRKA